MSTRGEAKKPRSTGADKPSSLADLRRASAATATTPNSADVFDMGRWHIEATAMFAKVYTEFSKNKLDQAFYTTLKRLALEYEVLREQAIAEGIEPTEEKLPTRRTTTAKRQQKLR